VEEVELEVLELFDELGATEQQVLGPSLAFRCFSFFVFGNF